MSNQKDNSTVLFRNDKKTETKHPDYKGHGLIFGKEVWVSAWINTAKDGTKYMSHIYTLKDTPKDQFSAQDQIKNNPSDTQITDLPF